MVYYVKDNDTQKERKALYIAYWIVYYTCID